MSIFVRIFEFRMDIGIEKIDKLQFVRKKVNDSWLKPRACSYPVVRTKAEPSSTFVTSKLADAASRGG